MRFQCTNCLSVVSIDDSEAGQAVACGQCSSVIVVPRHPTASGAVIGDFVIEKEVAHGGLATVYLAHQISLDRPAALKILYDQHASDPDYISNFISEARAAAQINHPNIVQAYAVGEDSGHHYFAMEFVQGATLKSLLTHSGRLVIERALQFLEEIGKALDFAWTNKQLVHRDIKPDNIIITENGQVKLADLGLAKIGKDFLKSDEDEVFGTPQYISPELLIGQAADHRSDIYSLGATFYHAITGKYPYTGNSAAELAQKHVTDRLPPPKSIVPEIPESVSGLIEVMMAKRPGQRYQSAAEVLQEIERYNAGKPLRRSPRPEFQNPINLNRIDEELEKTAEQGEKTRASTGGELSRTASKSRGASPQKKRRGKPSAKESGGKQSGTDRKRTLRTSKKTGKVTLKSSRGRPGRAAPAGGKNGDQAEGTKPETVAPKTEAPENDASSVQSEKSAAGSRKITASGTGQPPAGDRAGKPSKSGTSILIAVIIGVLALGIAAVIGAVLFVQREEQVEAAYSPAQQQALTELKTMIREGTYHREILEQGRDLLTRNPDAEAFQQEILNLLQPQTEEQIRNLRREVHERQMISWRNAARQIQEQREEERRAALEKARQEKLEEEQRLEKERREQERQEYIAGMEARQEQLRRQSITLCREHDFDDARLLFTKMLVSRIDRFRDWGRMKQRSIDLAQEAYNLVRNSGDLLADTSFRVPGRPRPAKVVRIGRRNIHAEFREKIYERGQFVREDVDPIQLRLDRLPLALLLSFMEKAWARENADDDVREIDLRLGAYLLAIGRNLDRAQEYLTDAGQADIARELLAELKEVRAVLE